MIPNDPSIATLPAKRIPEPYLRAEIAAFPLVGEESFRSALLELDPQLSEPMPGEENSTRRLWRACENKIAQHTGWSLDRLVSARDRGWFGLESDQKLVPMHRYLRALARSHLVARAGVTEIEESTDLSSLDATNHYRWLTITLPEDLLLCALGVEPSPASVDIDPPLLVRHLLDAGVAEIHQHIGAGMSFPFLWASALAAIASSDVGEKELESPGAPLSDGKFLVRWLLAAAVARCALAEHLIRGEGNFREFLHKEFLSDAFESRHSAKEPSDNEKSSQFREPIHHPAWTPRRREMLVAVLDALATGDDKRLPEIEPLRDLYADIHPTALTLRDDPINRVADVFRRCDPIAVRLDLHGENVGERWLLRQSLAYLDKGDGGHGGQYDKYFACIFWQTVRIRCQYYRAVVERPLTGGLQWFIRFYGRLGKLRNPLNPILPEISYHVAGERHRIKALELRTSIEDTAIGIGEQVLTIVQSWQRVLRNTAGSTFEPELGVIFHFVKSRDTEKAWSEGVPAAFWVDTHAEPYKLRNKGGRSDVEHGRYVGYFAGQCRKARALAELIRAVPSCLWFIRGLDVATDELGVPTWVLAPLFRHVLDEAAKVSIREGAGPPLRLTAHVGEDFRHLLEGMRRIYEQVHYILGNTPGRLGHAVALGVDPQTWAESVGSILMPAEERLWDLVWEWRLYSKYRIKPEYAAVAPAGRVDVLINQVRELSDFVYGKPCYRVDELAEAYHMLHRFLVPPFVKKPAVDGGFDTFLNGARNIKTWNSHERQVHAHDRVGEILENYFDNELQFQRGQTLIDVPMHMDEVAALLAVQNGLRRGIAQNGIVVEVNPSSNLLIGDLLDLRNHPILRLFPPVPEPGDPPPVMIALGSDDPLTFSTQLLREYTLLHQAASAAGYSERVVQDWLELIRRTGMDARFTRAWKPCAEKKAESLIRDLTKYLHLPHNPGTGLIS
jgi:hypothetical protein